MNETAGQVTAFAKKSGKSEKDVEGYFKKAMGIAKEGGRKEDDEDFWPYVVGIVKKMSGISETKLSTELIDMMR